MLEQRLQAGDAPKAALTAAAAECRRAADATKEMVAKRGRAAYTGERSKGSVDAGAMGLAVLAEKLAAVWPGEEEHE